MKDSEKLLTEARDHCDKVTAALNNGRYGSARLATVQIKLWLDELLERVSRGEVTTPDRCVECYGRKQVLSCQRKNDWYGTLREEMAQLSDRTEKYREALERIANEDYRGNRPYASVLAKRVLAEVGATE